MDDYRERSRAAQATAAHAFNRLVHLAETGDTGQTARLARVIAGLYDGQAYPLDLFELRQLDVGIGDDVLLCIDALRWGMLDLYKLIANGDQRVQAVIRRWGVAPPELPTPADGAELLAKFVAGGHAPGYRDVSLTFDCQLASGSDPGAKAVRIMLNLDQPSTVSVAEHIINVQRLAWSRAGGRPLDSAPGDIPPRWATS